jgi:hypothetical protein
METIERLEKRFGAVAVEKGFITKTELTEALKLQVAENLEGATHRLVGTILFEQGRLSVEQINEVLRDLGKPAT